MAIISCPNCTQPINPQARYCEHCGSDLALAAVLAERRVVAPAQIPHGVPLAPEMLVPRIGDYLIENGLLQPEGLQQALNYQKEQAEAGQPILLGQALLALKLVDREALDQAITTQILQLQNALSAANRDLQQRVQERTLDLQRALDRLAELNQLKSNFIANISHELRTPLTHLKGYLDLLGSGGLGPLERPQCEAIGVMQRAETRLERLIEDLIQFSLASRGELSINFEPTSIERLIKVAVHDMELKAKNANLTLVANLPENLPLVNIDAEKIGWVLTQLLDNALKFTPGGGRVEVEARLDKKLVRVSVNDTGIGIPTERVNEIFEPFHQLDGSATRRYGGTGLGLAMVRRIIDAHNSEVTVQSVFGQGSRFEFVLPLADE